MPGFQNRKSGLVRRIALAGTFLSTMGGALNAEDIHDPVSFNLYGSPGLVDMPTAEVPPDATLAGTYSNLNGTSRTTLYFQILPRLSGSFRYSAIESISAGGPATHFDRSFDLRYQLLTETDRRPSVVVGLKDFIGTGVYSGEYLVATKTLRPGLKVTGGFGWGRYGSHNPFGTTGTRAGGFTGRGGLPEFDRFFRGDVAAFGGVSYAPNDRLNFKVEYSSDDYSREARFGGVDVSSPWNFGVDYRFKSGGHLSVYHILGNEIGAQFTFVTNPKTIGVAGGIEPSGLPVAPRAPGAAADLGWTLDPQRSTSAKASLKQLAAKEGLEVEAVDLQSNRATIRMVNPRYGAPSQALGRMARAMTRALPASVEVFEIVPVVNGMAMASVTFRRSDLERLEHDAANEMLARTAFNDGFQQAPAPDQGIYPKFTWSLSPYMQLSVFDPDNPVRADVGLRAAADIEITPNLILSGSVTKKLNGSLDQVKRLDESSLPRVRTDHAQFSAQGDPAIEFLQLAHYGRPAKNVYSRVTVGYLEQMYGGVSAEVLWKPVTSRLAVGAEVNYIQRRDFDQLFGFQSMTTTDPVTGTKREIPNVNGHISAYYAFGNGFHGQLDVGRYLAGDYGATISLDREFANGWRVGAYATFTDASFEDFGEGSFDKGIRFTLPLASFFGQPSRRRNDVVVQSLSRDGGARLNVNGRLYEQVRDYHKPDAVNSWGRFWR
ncbi:YjbH domain-containing protein [Antarctobacter sp.]|uniref:YjbH domain-containing protein n=1 Tax=Antarctobacter sp. TaxID=1872577 RepID=UPI002B27444D|nr:YjbH domain-containing protein [Antarctobacter sp.]